MLFDKKAFVEETLRDIYAREREILRTLENYSQSADTQEKQRTYAQLQLIYAKEQKHLAKCRSSLLTGLVEG